MPVVWRHRFRERLEQHVVQCGKAASSRESARLGGLNSATRKRTNSQAKSPPDFWSINRRQRWTKFCAIPYLRTSLTTWRVRFVPVSLDCNTVGQLLSFGNRNGLGQNFWPMSSFPIQCKCFAWTISTFEAYRWNKAFTSSSAAPNTLCGRRRKSSASDQEALRPF